MGGPSKRSFGFCTRRTPAYTILSMRRRGEEVIPPMDIEMQLRRRMVTEWPNNDKCLLRCINIGHFIKFSPSSPVTPVAPHIPARPSTLCCHAPCSLLPPYLLSCCYICLIGPLFLVPDESLLILQMSSFTFHAGGGSSLMVLNSSSHNNSQSNDSGSE